MDSDEIDIELRSPTEVAARAIVVAAVLRRVALEDAAATDADDAAAEAFDLREWLRGQRLADAATAHERSLLDRLPGDLSVAEVQDESWLGEGFAVLAWALALAELPPLGGPAAIDTALAALPAPWDSTAAWIAAARLRPEPAIAAARERAELWHWRASVEAARRSAAPADRAEYDEAIREVAAEAGATGLLDQRAAGDFALGGDPVRALPADRIGDLTALAAERLRALNWLCGFGVDWDDVPLDI
jgi:hypothetical protein